MTLVLSAAIIIGGAAIIFSTSGGKPAIYRSKADCVYTANNIEVLQLVSRLLGRNFDCVVVFNNASKGWAQWEHPWFVNDLDPRFDWNAWARAPGARRQLIITQNLFPSALNGSDWLDAGAAGAYVEHAKALARTLVAAGLGSSVIRLAHEANDTSDSYALGTTDRQLRLWREFWRNTVIAMRSVPGAHFLFDWCVNAYWRPIPLSKWYPGDDVVNFIGIDAYDAGVPPGEDRWTRLYTQPDGIREVLQFAAAHGKPASIPEWGLWPARITGGGNDPNYIDHMASIVRNNRIAYQSYFFADATGQLLASSPSSLSAYRRHFGSGGDSVGGSVIAGGG